MKKVAQTAARPQSNVLPFPAPKAPSDQFSEPFNVNLHDLLTGGRPEDFHLIIHPSGESYELYDRANDVFWSIRRAA